MSANVGEVPPPLVETNAPEQDAGNRIELGFGNSAGHPAKIIGRRAVTAAVPGIQDSAMAVSATTTPGESRIEALVSTLAPAGGHAPALIPGPRHSQETFRALQEWEGTVLERRQGAIRVRLADKTNSGREEEAEIRLDEISPQDRDLVKPGGVFYWIIGYHDSATGQRSRQSIVVFRRLPAWTQRELQDIQEKVRNQKTLFGWT
jgi:hypothetical protein